MYGRCGSIGLLAISCFILVACGDTSTSNSIATVPGRSKFDTKITGTSPSLDSVGIWHNTACAYIYSNIPPASYASTLSARYQQLSQTGHVILQSTYGMDTTHRPSGESAMFTTEFPLMISNTNPEEIFDDVKARMTLNTEWSYVSGNDEAILDSIALFFQNYNTASKTYAQVSSDIISEMTSLLSYHSTLTWSGTGAGEPSKATLRGIQSSALYWKQWLDNYATPSQQANGAQDIAVIAQIDGGGMLVGWIGAIVEEVSMNGSLNPANSWKRVNAALRQGFNMSSGTMFSRWFGK